MGLFKKMRELGGGVSKDLMENGQLGRGIITDIQQTSVSTGADFDPSHVCVFTMEIALDNVPRYTASCRQAVKATLLPQLASPGTTVAVRVNPNDHSEVAIDLSQAPPEVTISDQDGKVGSAAKILEEGEACHAVIVQSQPLGMKNKAGVDMHAFVLTVMIEGRAPYQTQVGMPVPPEAVPLIYPGNKVPAKHTIGGADQEVVIDWQAALAQATAAG
jgi:hypothetical protein